MPGSAVAFDLNGAWASDADNCAKVFVRKGAQVSFAEMSEVWGRFHYRGRPNHRQVCAMPDQGE